MFEGHTHFSSKDEKYMKSQFTHWIICINKLSIFQHTPVIAEQSHLTLNPIINLWVWCSSTFNIRYLKNFYSRTICTGVFNFYRSNILTWYIHFYLSMTFGYFSTALILNLNLHRNCNYKMWCHSVALWVLQAPGVEMEKVISLLLLCSFW